MTEDILLYKIDVAIRMIGHLLLHHPTHSFSARNLKGITVSALDRTACCWCLIGACNVVGHRLRIDHQYLVKIIYRQIPFGSVRNMVHISTYWDRLDRKGREEFARKLSRYGIS